MPWTAEPSRCRRQASWPFPQPKHVAHGVEAGLPALRPERCLDRASGKDAAVLGAMRERDALAGTGEEYLVLADHGPAAQRGEADRALRPHTGVAVALAHAVLGQRYGAAGRGGLA